MYKAEEIYEGFQYPAAYLGIMDWDYWTGFGEWVYYTPENCEEKMASLKSRYPARELIPFAIRERSNDIACFENGKGSRVVIIHEGASSGQEQAGTYDNIWEWMHCAVDGMRVECNRYSRCGDCPVYRESNYSEAIKTLKAGKRYDELQCPAMFFCLLERDLVDFGAWNLLPEGRFKGTKHPLKGGTFIPFAECNIFPDDIACFDLTYDKVVILHDWWEPRRWRRGETYADFWLWLHSVVEDMRCDCDHFQRQDG